MDFSVYFTVSQLQEAPGFVTSQYNLWRKPKQINRDCRKLNKSKGIRRKKTMKYKPTGIPKHNFFKASLGGFKNINKS